LLPFRAKNPPEHFPFVAVGLIVVNAVVFALTSHYCLFVRREVVESFAVCLQATRSEMKDYSLLSLNDLSTLMQQPH